MSTLRAKAGELVERFVAQAIASGLTWDEAVVVFGLPAKASAITAAEAGDGTTAECVAHARARFEDAFAQQIHVVVADPSMVSPDAASGDNELLAIAHRRQLHKHSGARTRNGCAVSRQCGCDGGGASCYPAPSCVSGRRAISTGTSRKAMDCVPLLTTNRGFAFRTCRRVAVREG